MNGTFDNVSLLPWQFTSLTWMAGFTLGLFLLAIVPWLVLSFSKRALDKIHSVLCLAFGAFLFSFVISITLAISFLVDVELGWKLSLLAGASVVLCATSVIAMLSGLLKRGMKYFFIWAFLFMLSFASVFKFLDMCAQKVDQEQSKKQAFINSVNQNQKNWGLPDILFF
jgi:hypothetical protein